MRLWYDADGHIQSSRQGNAKAAFNLIVNGQVLGQENADGKTILGSTYLPVPRTATAYKAPAKACNHRARDNRISFRKFSFTHANGKSREP